MNQLKSCKVLSGNSYLFRIFSHLFHSLLRFNRIVWRIKRPKKDKTYWKMQEKRHERHNCIHWLGTWFLRRTRQPLVWKIKEPRKVMYAIRGKGKWTSKNVTKCDKCIMSNKNAISFTQKVLDVVFHFFPPLQCFCVQSIRSSDHCTTNSPTDFCFSHSIWVWSEFVTFWLIRQGGGGGGEAGP